MRRATFLLMLLITSACATAPIDDRAQVDLIVTGGIVVTISGPNIENGAVAIRNNEIIAVGKATEIDRAFRANEVIDATGGAVMPGLVNAHTHAPMTLFRGIADDLALMDWLQNFIFPAEARNVDAEFVRWGTRLAAAEMILSGTTTYADMYYFEADVARETRAAGLRGVLGETVIDFPAPDNKTWDEAIEYTRAFVNEFANDALITPAIAPHAPYTVSADHLAQVRDLATELGIPILIHVSETRDEQKQIAEAHGGMSPTEYLESIGFLGDDVIAAHGVWLSESDIALFAKHRVGLAHCPESNMMIASGVAPVPSLIAAGVELGLGTDGPAGSNNDLDMVEEMASAARLQKVMREDPRALGARAVLEMATIGGAKAVGLEDRIGTIEPGKLADLIVIDLFTAGTQPIYSVESAIVYAASGDNVTTTIVNGRVLMRDRRLLTIDLKETLHKAQEYRDRVLSSLDRE